MGLAMVAGGSVGKVSAQSGADAVDVPDVLPLPKRFVDQLLRTRDPDERLLKALQQFEQLDMDGDGITENDLERNRKMQAARLRASMLNRYLTHDFDANGIVTRQEMEDGLVWGSQRRVRRQGNSTSARLRMKQRVKQMLEPFDKADTDKNGELTVSEMYQSIDSDRNMQRRLRGQSRFGGLERTIMKLDFNGDGTVSEDEFVATISRVSTESILSSKASNSVRIVEPGCEIPEVNKTDKLVLFSAYEGTAVSNVTISGQDKETTAAELYIEEGPDPLYLVIVSFEGIVWNVMGATDRVRQVVLSSHAGANEEYVGSGLVGIDKSKVDYVIGRHCVGYFHKPDGIKQVKAKASVRAMAGRDPDYVLGTYGVGSAVLPNGPAERLTVRHRPPTKDRKHRELLRFSPSGLMKFDASKVVSQRPAKEYEVLPQEAGLMQLLKEGKIERVRQGYRIKEKIRVPAGLTGSHSVTFLLAPGVPVPDGDPGHSCIVSEETGNAIGRGARCSLLR